MCQNGYSPWCYGQPIYRESGNEERKHCRKQKWCDDRDWECEPWDRCKKCCDPCDHWDRCHKCCDPCDHCDRCHKCDEDKKHKENEKCDSDVNICTSVNIWQNGEANGGDANGGNGGNATGGSASAAFAESEGDGDASATASVSPYRRSEFIGGTASANQASVTGQSAAANKTLAADQASVANQALETVQSLVDDLTASVDLVLFGEGASAVGGDAAGGEGGDGGTGGAGGSVSNSASVTVENYVIICCDENGSHGMTLGTNNRKVNIKVDENGDTFVNGQKMDETALEDGTKVLIFRNSESKKSETVK